MKPISYILLSLLLILSCESNEKPGTQNDISSKKELPALKLPKRTLATTGLSFAYLDTINKAPCTLYVDIDVSFEIDLTASKEERNKRQKKRHDAYWKNLGDMAKSSCSYLLTLPEDKLVAKDKEVNKRIKSIIDSSLSCSQKTYRIEITNLSTKPGYSKRVYFQRGLINQYLDK